MLRKIVAISLLAVLSGVACAADWKLVTSSDSADLYFDASTVRRAGSKVKVWALLDFKKPQLSAGNTYLSDRYLEEIDCAEQTSRDLAYSFLAENMGNGSQVFSSDEVGKWRELAPDTLGRALMAAVCK